MRHKKAKRSSGGIAILIANWLNKHIESKRVNECLVRIIFKDCININTNKKLMFGVVYVPPIDSSYIGIKQDIFDIIELEYSKYVNNHDIFLCGDFNARTSNLPDFITDEYTVFNGIQPNFVSFDILADSQRYNMDTKANTYGKLLLELCKNTGLIIVNGRLYQDKHRGSFTFLNRNGSSVIDYMLFEPNCLSMIKNFAIIPKLVESDNCPIEFGLKVRPFCNTSKSIKAYDHVAEYNAYHKYIWNVSRIDQYKLSLRNECIMIIDHLTLNATSDRSSDHICELIQNLINIASFGILKKVNINTNNSSEKQMPTNAWFDSECNKLRKTKNTYAKRANLTDTDNNNYYHTLFNDYKRMIQRKK